ncbi:MAG TPA: MbnP family protein [Saprospiraceae bacterium]|nr:MbnP family protein [Saprospiraceae bacterium]
MKLFKLFLLASVIALGFSACEDDDDTMTTNETIDVLTFNLQPLYNGEPLQMRKIYSYDDTNGSSVQFDKIEFFISDLTLIDGNNSSVIRDVHSFNYDDYFSVPEHVGEGLSFTMENVPAGQQTFTFGFGVSPNLNGTTPSDYSVDHPLGDGSDYWIPWESYIFSKHEGKYYSANNADTTNFIFHTGADNCYGEISSAVDLSASEEQITVEIDFYELFKQDDGELFHIPDEPVLHRLDQQELVDFFCENFISSTSVAQE